MKTLTAVTSAASVLAFTVALAAMAGCAVEPDTSTDAANDESNVAAVEQGLGPSQPCEMIPGGCEGGGGQDDGPPEHHNKGIVKLCATQRTTCYHKCKGTNAQIIACQKKCDKAHTECLEDY